MKRVIRILPIIFIVLALGCKNNPTSSQSNLSTMVQKVNNGRPYTNILVYASTGNEFYGPGQNSFQDAYAKNGYLIIIFTNNSKSYFNLSSAHEIDIYQGNLYLKYN